MPEEREGRGENRIQLSWSLQTYQAAGTGRLGAEEGAVTVALAVAMALLRDTIW